MTAHDKLLEELRAINLAPKMTIDQKDAYLKEAESSDKTESD